MADTARRTVDTELVRRKGRFAAARPLAAAREDKWCPTKRKAVSSGDLPKAGAGEALDIFLSPADLAMMREKLRADLLTFPEAAALDQPQLDDAVNRIIKESTPSTATPTAQGMVRFNDKRISAAFNCAKWLGTPSTEDLPSTGVFPPGWLDQRRRKLDEEMKPEKRDELDNSGFLLAKIRVDLLTKGYVELPKLYIEYTPPLPIRAARSSPKNITALVGV